MSEYTFDAYMLATVKVQADTFAQARTMLRGLDAVDFGLPVNLSGHVTMTTIEFRGAAAAWAPEAMPAVQGAAVEAHYATTGFAALERFATSSPHLPLLFEAAQQSPEGHDMRSASAPVALENLIARFPVIRVGLAGMVCVVDEIAPPPVWVDHDGTVHIEADGWDTIGEPAGQHNRTGAPLLGSRASIVDQLTQHLHHPGLYAVVVAAQPDSWILLFRDDSEDVWKELG